MLYNDNYNIVTNNIRLGRVHILEDALLHTYRSRIYQNIRKRVLILTTLVLLVIVGIIVASFFMASTLNMSSSVVNVLGRQRMYTQSIGMNASRISVLYTAIASEERTQEKTLLLDEVDRIKEKLLEDAERFREVLMSLQQGYVIIDDTEVSLGTQLMHTVEPELNDLMLRWPSYAKAVEIIGHSDASDATFSMALNEVNENNEMLLYDTQNITNQFNQAILEQYRWYRNISYGFIFILIVLACILIFSLYNNLFSAINVLYTEFEKLGIDHNHVISDMRTPSLSEEIRTLLLGFSETLELVERINASGSFPETLDYIYNSFSQYLPYTYIGIALLKDTNPVRIVASYGIGGEQHPNLAKMLLNYEVALKKTSLSQIMDDSRPRIINDMDEYFETHPKKEYSRIIVENGIKSSITLPLKANGVPLGFIFFSSNQKNVYEEKHIEYLKLISNSIALSFEKNIFSEDLVYSSVLALAKLSEARDEDTGEHLIRMSRYVEILATALSETERYRETIDQAFINNIVRFSPMHDIGKVGIPDNILLKPGKLDAREFEIMKTHTIYGADVLNEAEVNIKRSGRSLFGMGIRIALYHHERYDGTGYPYGLSGEDIPIESRIVTIADVFDALLSKRPYKESFTLEKTMAIMKAGRGSHFDPYCLDVFLDNIDKFIKIQKKYQ